MKLQLRSGRDLVELTDYLKRHENYHTWEMIEIGCFNGESTEQFCKFFDFKKMYCIDPWLNGYDDDDNTSKADMNLAESNFDKMLSRVKNDIEKIKMKSKDAVKKFKTASIDFVYIDGCHTYEGVKSDIKLYLPKVKKGGFIGGHDYDNSLHPGVTQAVDELLGIPDITFPDSSWLKYIP